jgi:4-amino-4-deoxy-L-arabinose transferase-like glycosyltransferase
MMSKGPVALIQTVVPVLAFVAWTQWRLPRIRLEETELTARRRFGPPLLVGFVVFAIVGFAWYGFVMWNNPGVLAEWRSEVTREGATDMEPSRWYNYVLLLIHIVPWTFFLVAGLIGAGTLFGRKWSADEPRGARRIVLPLMLLLVPVLVMSFFRDREIRYVIPLLSPAAVIAGWAVAELLAPPEGPRWRNWLVGVFHWLPLLAVSAGLLIAASPVGVVKTARARRGTRWRRRSSGRRSQSRWSSPRCLRSAAGASGRCWSAPRR